MEDQGASAESASNAPGQSQNEQASMSLANNYWPVPKIAPSAEQQEASGESSEVYENMTDMSTERVCYSESHFVSTFKHMNDIRLQGALCDITVSVDTHKINCHRLVLAASSRYFRTMFTAGMKESNLEVVEIHDVLPSAVESLIEYCYTGHLKINVDNVQQLLFAATFLQIEEVQMFCSEFMCQHLHPANVVSVRLLAESHGHKSLTSAADDYIINNFLACTSNEDFCQLPAATLCKILSSDNLFVDSETQILDAVLRWVSAGDGDRDAELPSLFEAVRLELLPIEDILALSKKFPLLRNNIRCRDILEEASMRHLRQLGVIKDEKSIPVARPRRSTAGVIFCVGGRGTGGDPFRSIECFDWLGDRWFMIPEMRKRRRHVGVVSTGKRLYAVGGHDGVQHLSSGEVYDATENKWSSISNMKYSRRGLALACVEGENSPIYAVGGLDDSTCYNVVEQYDPVSNTWFDVTCMSVKRGGVGLTVIKQNRLVAVGGNDGLNSLDSVEMFDPLLNRWAFLNPMHFRRAGAGVASLDSKVFAVGGFNDNLPLASNEVYCIETQQWSLLAPMSCARGGVGVAPLAGTLITVGGHDGSGYLNSVESYDPATNSWRSLPSITQRRAGAGVCYCNWQVCKLMAQKTPATSCGHFI